MYNWGSSRHGDGAGLARASELPGGSLHVRVPAARRDLDPDGPSVSVVIPALNEARNLPWLASRMPAGVAELIVVDGHSVDGTIPRARALWPEVRIVHQNRRGKGNALACGFAAATGDIIVMLDADGSMDPGEIPYFVDALVDGADYAKGSRFKPGGGSSDITRFRAAGNHVLNLLTGLVHQTAYTDLCYGFNAFWRRILSVLALEVGEGEERRWGDGFEVETLINIRVHSAGLTVTEVPSYEGPRLHGASNLRAFSDGWRVLSIIARESRALRNSAHVRSAALEQLLNEQPGPAAPVVNGMDRHAEEGVAFAWPAPELERAGYNGASPAEREDNVIQLDYASAAERRAELPASAIGG